jgi:hypothetical protein
MTVLIGHEAIIVGSAPLIDSIFRSSIYSICNRAGLPQSREPQPVSLSAKVCWQPIIGEKKRSGADQ